MKLPLMLDPKNSSQLAENFFVPLLGVLIGNPLGIKINTSESIDENSRSDCFKLLLGFYGVNFDQNKNWLQITNKRLVVPIYNQINQTLVKKGKPSLKLLLPLINKWQFPVQLQGHRPAVQVNSKSIKLNAHENIANASEGTSHAQF